jgi:hypothetical protein
MGLLDDAIREHLELKRRRGADPTEVERLEREALGPMRRGPQATEEGPVDQEVLDQPNGEAVIFDDQGEPYDPSSEDAPELDEGELPTSEPAHAYDEAEPAHEPFPEDESERGWSHEPAEAWDVEDPLASKEPAAQTPPAAAPPPTEPAQPAVPHSDHPGEETVEYDVEAGELSRRDREEDVLEETPEFLQDTPDHDRLWFEQRPPRDFDFDK